MGDFVDELLATQGTSDTVSGMGMDEDYELDEHIGGLVEVGALTEVGAATVKALVKKMADHLKSKSGQKPSPPFARSARDTERRAPLGMTEDGTGRSFFTLAAAIGATTTMRGKVSRVAHVNRLLIVPSAPGVVIGSIKVGDEEQCLAAGVPVEIYGTSALTDTEPDNFSPLGPALDFQVTLVNTTAGAITGTIGCKAACKR